MYARDLAPGEVVAAAVAENPEDREFPQRVPLTAGKELVKIVAENEVVLDNTDPQNGRQRAGGTKAVYEVQKRSVVLTGEKPKQAYVIRYVEKQKVSGDTIVYELNTGDYQITGGVTQAPYRGD
ncbi:hypothetical protein SDC9_167394 [bioreactor metagenome]|uniref:Organic solvent tolerance-like N-terminal domain-containing protein n=1 Tax=bioreactor metagenome TaxID=1076179 RepID=A0A645FZM8_9ZZZZ